MMISNYVSYKEATKSADAIRLGIDNAPNSEELERMKLVATECFDKIRAHFDVPIGISSFFRSKKLNAKIRGASTTSQHVLGEAIDIDADMYGNVTNRQIFEFIRDNLEWDQLIYEFGSDENPDWVHVSYTARRKNRKQILRAVRSNGKTQYYTYR